MSIYTDELKRLRKENARLKEEYAILNMVESQKWSLSDNSDTALARQKQAKKAKFPL